MSEGGSSGGPWWQQTWVRVAGFAVAVVAIFVGAIGIGRLVDPAVDAAADGGHGADGHGAGGHEGHATASEADGAALPEGLAVSREGYTLRLVNATLPAADDVPLAFRVVGPGGTAVTSYEKTHERDLHLVLVRRDFAGFQHVHPTLAADGTWTAPVDLVPGAWRVFADFQATGGSAVTLGADLAVPGTPAATVSAGPVRSSSDGAYTVTLAGELTAGEHSMVTATVTRAGRPVTDLQPYLGAYGHLVALREGDLAYLHVHPDGEPGDGKTRPGPEVRFGVEVPTAGRYHLFLDYRDGGVVRTAAFTVDAVAT